MNGGIEFIFPHAFSCSHQDNTNLTAVMYCFTTFHDSLSVCSCSLLLQCQSLYVQTLCTIQKNYQLTISYVPLEYGLSTL